jgi:hypothetical protein
MNFWGSTETENLALLNKVNDKHYHEQISWFRQLVSDL